MLPWGNHPSIFPRWDGVRSITDILAHIGVALGIALVLSRSARRALDASPPKVDAARSQ